ncbi:MFS general substrate transporter [Rhizophagus irregularis]|uniref:MFS general substrate transporter n=1 Tax=Rhizophagus irregularis TaxID=588596 RepID=A0A2N0S8T3_9GLOM|nr:MFS general substrate transporter [Rhizophagus irregularis]
MIGCCLILFLAILDVNLVANQLPKILEEFKSGEEFSWLINSHSLTSTMLQPFCRKLSTIFGKKLTFLVSILIFGASSVLCGASQNIQWLIATRATMGIGSGMIASMTFIIISEVLPYKQKVFYNIVMNIIFAIAFIIGPLLGGLFVDYVSWRWSFYMNGPLSIICIIILLIALRKFGKSSENTSTKLKEVDWLGIFLLASGLLLLLFGLNYGGNKFPWISVTILTIFGVGFVILMFFGIFEKIFVKKPLIPTSMFKDSSIRAIFGCFYFIGWIQVIVIYYTPIYFQYVRLQSATQSGISLLPLVSSVVIFCAISGTLVIKFEKYKWLLYIGSISLIGGGFLLSTLNLTTETLLRVIALIVIGCGIGTQFILLIPALRAVKKGEKSGMIGLCNFFRGYGFIFGISISTALFDNHILSNMKNTQNYPIKSSLNDVLSLKNIRQLDEEQKNIILNSINNGISTIYILCIFVAVMGLIFASFLKNYNLRNDTEDNNNNSNNNNFEVLNEKII